MKQATSRRAVQLLAAAALGAVLTAAAFGLAHSDSPPEQYSLSATDIGFAQDMTVHHQQAALMADVLTLDAAPEVKALADEIRLTQIRESGVMMGWLQIAQAPMISSSPMTWMGAEHGQHSGAGGATMPGMASPDDLTRLQRTSGRDNEIWFLQLMIRHHQGGIDMAAYANQHSTSVPVRQLAVSMIDKQTQEVGLMMFLLDRRGSTPLPFP